MWPASVGDPERRQPSRLLSDPASTASSHELTMRKPFFSPDMKRRTRPAALESIAEFGELARRVNG